jgi:hypothetical protein
MPVFRDSLFISKADIGKKKTVFVEALNKIKGVSCKYNPKPDKCAGTKNNRYTFPDPPPASGLL